MSSNNSAPTSTTTSSASAPAEININHIKTNTLYGAVLGLAFAIVAAVVFGSFSHFLQIVVLMTLWGAIYSIRHAVMGIITPPAKLLFNGILFAAVFTAMSVILSMTTGFTLMQAFEDTTNTKGFFSAYYGLKGSSTVGLGYLITLSMLWITTGVVSRKTIKTFGFGFFVVCSLFLFADRKYEFTVEHMPEKHVQKVIQQKLKQDINTKYQENVEELRAQLNAGKISDSQFNRAYANEQGIREYRTRTAENPISGICQSEMLLVSDKIREYPLPAICENGFGFPVWPDGPKKTIKAELMTKGGDALTRSPKLEAGRGSTAIPLGNNRWEVEGNVSYIHEQTRDDIKLRITTEP